jgi:hypothetical protein
MPLSLLISDLLARSADGKEILSQIQKLGDVPELLDDIVDPATPVIEGSGDDFFDDDLVTDPVFVYGARPRPRLERLLYGTIRLFRMPAWFLEAMRHFEARLADGLLAGHLQTLARCAIGLDDVVVPVDQQDR